MPRSSYSKEMKLSILNLLNEGNHTIQEIALKFHIDWSTIQSWKEKYETAGEASLEEVSTWQPYSKELKLAAVEDYLSQQYSLREVVYKYGISSTSVLRRWIRKYNDHRELKDTGKGISNSMTKRRKTTLEERIQIVKYCLKQQKNYQLSAETFDVSYQQVYQWVKKYEANGEEALIDKRGRTKEETELTPDEKFTFEMKRLERENERLRAENAFLKKLEEIERRRH